MAIVAYLQLPLHRNVTENTVPQLLHNNYYVKQTITANYYYLCVRAPILHIVFNNIAFIWHTVPFLALTIWVSFDADFKNRCLERFPMPDSFKALSKAEMLNFLSLSSDSFAKGVASVVRTAMHVPKWHAVTTSIDNNLRT